MSPPPASFIWPQFILAAALTRIASRFDISTATNAFCYADTHAGPGRIPSTQSEPFDHPDIINTSYFKSLSPLLGADIHPGSWVTAARVLQSIFANSDDYELDVNDIDPSVLEQAKLNHETGRLRLWSHDWFKFLRDRLSMARPPNFVFIDPPPNDPRGPGFAVNAALLLDTVKCPYLMTYNEPIPQYVINLIGRTAVEITIGSQCTGVVLGGGAEAILLSILPDLKQLTKFLSGEFAIQTPRNDDYTI